MPLFQMKANLFPRWFGLNHELPNGAENRLDLLIVIF
jgi:hypothetical protein